MVFHTQTHNMLKMSVVYVCIDPEKTLENDFYCRVEVFGKRYADGSWEEMLVVELVFNPGHEVVYVLAGGDFEWGSNALAISP